jgi:hypothetical protein
MEYFALGFMLKFHHNHKSLSFLELTTSSISVGDTNLNLIGGIICLNASCDYIRELFTMAAEFEFLKFSV